MLTGYQCEVVAFIGEGEFICYNCAQKALDAGEFAQSELGLGSLSPVIRYSLDEFNGERVYEAAEEAYEERAENGTAPVDDDGTPLEKWRAIDVIAEELEDAYAECCSECGEVIK